MKNYFDNILCRVGALYRRQTVVLFAAALLVVAISPLMFALEPVPYVSDSELIELFKSKRNVFEHLRQIAIEDSTRVSFIDQNTLKDSPISENRRTEYTKAFAELGRYVGIGTGSRHVTFRFTGGGSAIERSWMKGLTYFPAAKSGACTFVTNLDNPPKQEGTYLVPIVGDWYIVFGQID
jgi:hypothetical protein